MSRQGAQWDDYEQDREHKVRRIAKLQRIQGLRDLARNARSKPRQRSRLRPETQGATSGGAESVGGDGGMKL